MLLPKFPYRGYGLRVIATFLTLSLALPPSALALRTEQKENKGGLEEIRLALEGGPDRLLELTNTALGLPSSSATPTTTPPTALSPRPAAGLEEGRVLDVRYLNADDDKIQHDLNERRIQWNGTKSLVEAEFRVKKYGRIEIFPAGNILGHPHLERLQQNESALGYKPGPGALGQVWISLYQLRDGRTAVLIHEIQPGDKYGGLSHKLRKELDTWRRAAIEEIARWAHAKGYLVFAATAEAAQSAYQKKKFGKYNSRKNYGWTTEGGPYDPQQWIKGQLLRIRNPHPRIDYSRQRTPLSWYVYRPNSESPPPVSSPAAGLEEQDQQVAHRTIQALKQGSQGEQETALQTMRQWMIRPLSPMPLQGSPSEQKWFQVVRSIHDYLQQLPEKIQEIERSFDRVDLLFSEATRQGVFLPTHPAAREVLREWNQGWEDFSDQFLRQSSRTKGLMLGKGGTLKEFVGAAEDPTRKPFFDERLSSHIRLDDELLKWHERLTQLSIRKMMLLLTIPPAAGLEEEGRVQKLCALLKNLESGVRKAAVESLGSMGPTAAPAVPDLISLLNEPPYLRAPAISALERIIPAAVVGRIDPQVKALQESLKNPNVVRRKAAVEELGKIGPKAAPAVRDLVGLLRDDSSFSYMQEAVVSALKRIVTPARPERSRRTGLEEDVSLLWRGKSEQVLSRLPPGLQRLIQQEVIPYLSSKKETKELVAKFRRFYARSHSSRKFLEQVVTAIQLVHWLNVYVLLPKGAALYYRIKRRKGGQWDLNVWLFRAWGYELLKLPGAKMPVSVIYISPRGDTPLQVERVLGWASGEEAFVRIQPEKTQIQQTRLEEVSHVDDGLRFAEKPHPLLAQGLNQLIERFGLSRSEGGLANYMKLVLKEVPFSEPLVSAYAILAEARAQLRWLASREAFLTYLAMKEAPASTSVVLQAKEENLDKRESTVLERRLAIGWVQEEFARYRRLGFVQPEEGPKPAAIPKVVHVEPLPPLLEEHLYQRALYEPKERRRFTRGIRVLSARLWRDNFSDPMRIRDQRLYPPTKEGADAQLHRLADLAQRRFAAGLEEGTPEWFKEKFEQLQREVFREQRPLRASVYELFGPKAQIPPERIMTLLVTSLAIEDANPLPLLHAAPTLLDAILLTRAEKTDQSGAIQPLTAEDVIATLRRQKYPTVRDLLRMEVEYEAEHVALAFVAQILDLTSLSSPASTEGWMTLPAAQLEVWKYLPTSQEPPMDLPKYKDRRKRRLLLKWMRKNTPPFRLYLCLEIGSSEIYRESSVAFSKRGVASFVDLIKDKADLLRPLGEGGGVRARVVFNAAEKSLTVTLRPKSSAGLEEREKSPGKSVPFRLLASAEVRGTIREELTAIYEFIRRGGGMGVTTVLQRVPVLEQGTPPLTSAERFVLGMARGQLESLVGSVNSDLAFLDQSIATLEALRDHPALKQPHTALDQSAFHRAIGQAYGFRGLIRRDRKDLHRAAGELDLAMAQSAAAGVDFPRDLLPLKEVIEKQIGRSGLEEGTFVSQDLALRARLRGEFLSDKRSSANFIDAVLAPFHKRPVPLPGVIEAGADYRVSPILMDEKKVETLRAMAEDLINRSTDNEAVRSHARTAIDAFLARIDGEVVPGRLMRDLPDNEAVEMILELVRVATGTDDPYAASKEESNQKALRYLKAMDEVVNRAADPLRAAMSLGIIGNAIDFADQEQRRRLEASGFDISAQIRRAEALPYRVDRRDTFLDALTKTPRGTVLFLVDNAGEIIFDLPLIRLLLGQGRSVVLAGKTLPHANDMTAPELEKLFRDPSVEDSLGREKVKQQIRIIASGTAMTGVDLRRVTKEFVREWQEAALIYAKGQGMIETLRFADLSRPVFHAVLVKSAEYFQRLDEVDPAAPFRQGDVLFLSPRVSLTAGLEENEVKHLIARALRAADEGRFDDALMIINRAEKRHRGHRGILATKANLLDLKGSSQEALALIEKVIEHNPRNMAARTIHAKILLHLNHLDEAEATIRKVLKLNPWDLHAIIMGVHILHRAGRYDEARRMALPILDRVLSEPKEKFVFASLLHDLRMYDRALQIVKTELGLPLPPDQRSRWLSLQAELLRDLRKPGAGRTNESTGMEEKTFDAADLPEQIAALLRSMTFEMEMRDWTHFQVAIYNRSDPDDPKGAVFELPTGRIALKLQWDTEIQAWLREIGIESGSWRLTERPYSTEEAGQPMVRFNLTPVAPFAAGLEEARKVPVLELFRDLRIKTNGLHTVNFYDSEGEWLGSQKLPLQRVRERVRGWLAQMMKRPDGFSSSFVSVRRQGNFLRVFPLAHLRAAKRNRVNENTEIKPGSHLYSFGDQYYVDEVIASTREVVAYRVLQGVVDDSESILLSIDHLIADQWQYEPPPAESTGLEEARRLRSMDYAPEEVAGRLLDALLRLDSLSTEKFFDPKTGKVVLKPDQAAQLLGHHPTGDALRRIHKSSGKSLAEEINEQMSKPEFAPPSLEKRWQRLFERRVVEVRILKSRQVDSRPWTEKRLSRVVKQAREKDFSFRPKIMEKGTQSKTPLGIELRKAYAQIARTDNFLQYERSWSAFLEAHRIPLQEVYGDSRPPRQREVFAAYVDLKRDEKGLPIPDRRKYITDMKINRLDSLWKNRRVKGSGTLFLIGVRTWLSKVDSSVSFGHTGKPHTTSIPADTFNPAEPVHLAVEIAVADPHHAAQVARRIDTGEVVYPFDRQIRFYLDPPFKNGRIQKGAFLFRALTWVRDGFWQEIARIGPRTVYATHVRTRPKYGARTNRAFFHVGPELLKSTSLPFSKKNPPLLTVQVDPATRESLQAWEMARGRKVFPRTDTHPAGPFQLFVDRPRDARGLVLQSPGTKPDLEVSNLIWAKVWSDVVRPGSKMVSIQGIPTYKEKRTKWMFFSFEGEPFSTGIPSSSGESLLLQLDFLAQDPHRRPQLARRMDTGEIVYPAPGHRRIRLASGKLHKAVYLFGSKVVLSALQTAEKQVTFENLPTIGKAGNAFFPDPIVGGYLRTSLRFQPGIFVTAIAEKNGDGRWAITRAYDTTGQEIFPVGREVVTQAKRTLLSSRAKTVDRALAAERLFRLGALDVPNGVSTDLLQNVLFDYHLEIFGQVGTDPFFRLSSRAAQRYGSEPGQFWRAVYEPLKQAEQLRPGEARQYLQTAAQALSAGLEETMGRVTAQERMQRFLVGLEQAAPHGMKPIVVGQSLQEMDSRFLALGGLEEQGIFLHWAGQEMDLLIRIAEHQADGFLLAGLEEEAGRMKPFADRLHLRLELVSRADRNFTGLIVSLLAQATGLEEAAIQARADFPAFMAGLEEFDSQA